MGSDALVRHLAALRHDLGKYVTFEQRAVGPDASVEVLRSALIRDLRSTRSGPDGVVDAVTLWDRLSAPFFAAAPLDDGTFVDLRGDPDLDRLAAAAELLRGRLPHLEELDPDEVLAVAEAARAVSDAARALHLRHRG